jgi:hypothetical protein
MPSNARRVSALSLARLSCFADVAEELHPGRAAERLLRAAREELPDVKLLGDVLPQREWTTDDLVEDVIANAESDPAAATAATHARADIVEPNVDCLVETENGFDCGKGHFA